MAADQLNKRSKVSNAICRASWEQQKAKKKKFSHYDPNMRASISLELDEKGNVVPKKEQVSIARRDLTQFLPLVPHCQNVLGDVFEAPPELFLLENLIDLLSYEVWQTHLSVQERDYLTKFLPDGAEPHKAVHELLAGNNLYFGNPFPKWGASICSGDCHPDAVLRQEQCNKANKIAYYSELHKYHTKMIGSLQLWKERWASCVNPEKDFMQNIKILRSRKDFHKSDSSHENDILCGPEDNFGVTSDSCSLDADDKSYSSDSPNLAMMHGETLIRVSRMDLENKYDDSSSGWRPVARPRKGDKLHKRNIECGDGAKYMSYIKVSKEQHQRVKSSMKHSNTSIQPRSLNHVLGNLDSFCVQPYDVFEEEERRRLHDHWSRLANKDLPAGFEKWKRWRSAKWQLTKSLRKELEDKQRSNDVSVSYLYYQEDNERNCTLLLDGTCNATSDNGLIDTTKDEEKEQSLCSLHHEQGETNEDNKEKCIIFQPEAENHATMQIEDREEIAIPPNGSQNLCPVGMESDGFHGCYTAGAPVAVGEVWPASAYYHHQPTTSGYDLSLGHPQVIEILQKDPLTSLVHRRDSFFNPYANNNNQERNELLLHPLVNEQKQSLRLGFHPSGASDAMLGSSLPLQKRLGDVYNYMHHNNIQENMCGGGIPPRQEHFLPLGHAQDWPGNGSQNWYCGDGWSNPNQEEMGNGSSSQIADESLFSVLSQFKGLHSTLGALPPTTSNALQPQPQPPPRMVNYMSGGNNEVGQSMGMGMGMGMGWINLNGGDTWNDNDLGC